jgi:hypothetical protein
MKTDVECEAARQVGALGLALGSLGFLKEQISSLMVILLVQSFRGKAFKIKYK